MNRAGRYVAVRFALGGACEIDRIAFTALRICDATARPVREAAALTPSNVVAPVIRQQPVSRMLAASYLRPIVKS